MIYFDNSATTLQKPPAVAAATAWAINNLGNAGRSSYAPAMDAARSLHAARGELSQFVGAANPAMVAFTSSATESLNLVVDALVCPGDGVIATVLEHNSVLRPLYRKGCALSFVGCDEQGNLLLEQLPALLTPKTKFVFATHGSNVLGTLTNTSALHAFCRGHNLALVLDAAQTIGQAPLSANMADVICFTGHKALYGPQGTGGIIACNNLPFATTKTGGAGADAFAKNQGTNMPDVFEAGTANVHSLHGLRQGVQFVQAIGLPVIMQREVTLTRQFIEGILSIPNIQLYGSATSPRLPVVSLNVGALPSEEVSLFLWEKHGIATRPGSHCAPLLHRRFGTQNRGMVRFSFSWFNTPAQINAALAALREVAHG